MDAKRATAKHNLLGSSPIVEVLLSFMFWEKHKWFQVAPVYVKPDTAAIHERIGFDPKPKLQWENISPDWEV